jgi:hypothetical protein
MKMVLNMRPSALLYLLLCSLSLFELLSAFSPGSHLQKVPRQRQKSLSQTSSDELISLGRQSSLIRHFPDLELDDWQYEAAGAISLSYNVIVCVPTGAGKTVVGEMALWHAFEQSRYGIYTTPLKALSNQKYTDLVVGFGKDQVGLSTGDISINKGADMTVMTTEVYRNMAWRQDEHLEKCQTVVLDEFHYMGVPGRGGVWEESVITSPPHVQLVALSATLTNADALAQWMQSVTQKPTILVVGKKRPVPLRYLYCTKEGLYDLFKDPNAGPGAPNGLLGLREKDTAATNGDRKDFGGGTSNKKTKLPPGLQVNPALKAAAEKRSQRVNRAMERLSVQQGSRNKRDGDDEDWRIYTRRRKLSPRAENKERERLLKKEMRRSVPTLSGLLLRLQHRDLLPAIFFIFSRAGCDNAAHTLYQYMKGPRDSDNLEQDEDDPRRERQNSNYKTGPSRQRRRKKQHLEDGLVQDKDGRSFRSSSNHLGEDVLASVLYNDASPPPPGDNESSPLLASDNWKFYAQAGLLSSVQQVEQVATRLARFNQDNPEIAIEDEILEQYMFGVGSHHA